MELICLVAAVGVLYSYALYPMLLSLTRSQRQLCSPETTGEGQSLPSISLIITAHNEEKRIREKIENSLQLEYTEGKLLIVVASDCSTDTTNEIVRSYKQVTLVEVDQHHGKEYAQLQAIEATSSDIVVFSDVATEIPADAMQLIAAYFGADPQLGALSSEDRFVSDNGEVAGEGLYVKYEMWLRKLESERAGLVGLSGSFFAARREILGQWDTRSPSDFNTALQSANHGMHAISCPDVLGYYKNLKDPSREYQRKVRTVLRGITALFRHTDSLNPKKHGLFAFQVFSHKLMRWLVPWFMLLFALCTLTLYREHWFYQLLVIGQAVFYAIALVGTYSESLRQSVLIRLVVFFVQVNVSITHAWIKYLSGARMTVWIPSER